MSKRQAVPKHRDPRARRTPDPAQPRWQRLRAWSRGIGLTRVQVERVYLPMIVFALLFWMLKHLM